jgi:hypothetical protein
MCGCNMAVEKRTLDEIGGFDPMFQTAGDDVDLSWRLTDRGDTLAYAPGAVVTHERRRTVRAYLAQQRGYGRAEALLFRKYPYRATDRIYGFGAGWKKLIGGSARVYYGAFGRGLFQTIYPNTNIGVLPELPLSFEWLAVAIFLLLAGVVNHTLLWFGAAAALVTVVTAFANAGSARFGRRKAGFPRRLVVAGLWIAGSVIRSYERFRARWLGAYRTDLHKIAGFWIKPKGELRLKIEAHSADALDQEKLLEAIRAVLIERGLAVGRGTGFADFDLEILINPIISIPINALFFGHGEMALRWRLRMHLLPLVSLACLIAVIAVSGSRRPFEAILSWTGLVLVLMLPAAIGDILETAAREGIERLGLRPQPVRSKKAA